MSPATPSFLKRIRTADPTALERLKSRGRGVLEGRAWFTWRRAILGGVLAFGALGMAGAVLVLDRGRGEALQAEVVAVMPFHPVGSGLDLWAEGLVDLVSTALDGTGAYHASDPRAVLLRWQREIGPVEELAEPSQAAAVASELEAGRMVLGSVIETGPGQVRVAADLFDVRWLRKVASAAVEGAESEMTSLVDRLTVELLKAIWREGQVPEVRVSTITTASIPALRAYLEGERAFRRSRFTEAQQALGRAVELDSTFAIAAHRLSFAYGWAGAFEEQHIEYALLAARHTEGLPVRDSLLITGHKRVDIDGDLGTIQLYENLTRRYPGDYEAWYGYGEALFHLGHQVGYGPERVVDAMARAYAIDPSVAPSLFHLIQGVFSAGQEDEARKWAGRYMAIDSSSSYARGLQLAVALRLGDFADSARAVQALDTVDLEVLRQVSFSAPPSRTSIRYSEILAHAAADPRFAPPDRAAALEDLGRQYLRHGRIADWLETDREADRIRGREDGIYDLTAARWAGLLDDPADVALQEQLAARESYPDAVPVLAVLKARQGRIAEARAGVDRLREVADGLSAASDTVGARASLGRALAYEGHIAAARGDTGRAVNRLQRGLELVPGFMADERNMHRYLLAELIEDRDELRAMRIFGSLYVSPWLEALGHFRRARLHDRRGESEDALRHYAAFLELWEGADAHLQPRVEAARRAVGRLTGEQVAVR